MSSEQKTTVKTRVCMLSDIHTSTPHHTSTKDKAYRHPLPQSDIFLLAGDLTYKGFLREHKTVVDMLKQDVDAELKIVIAGNHDISHDREYYARKGPARHGTAQLQDPEVVRGLYTDQAARDAGIVYMEEEVRTFTLRNGARVTVYASPYTPEFCGWAFAYRRDEDRFNPPTPASSSTTTGPVSSSMTTTTTTKTKVETFVPDFPNVDIMLTHGPPLGILDKVTEYRRVGCQHLYKACRRARPRLHVFGHIHEGFGAVRHTWNDNGIDDDVKISQDPETVLEERSCYYDMSSDAENPLDFGKETIFVNASVVTVGYHADNAPWVVDLDLPVADAASAPAAA